MTAETIQPPGWPRPRGYANGMLAHGALLCVAGQIGWDANERLVAADFAGQFRQALHNVVTVVRTAGGEPRHLVSLTVFVTDKHEYLASVSDVGVAWRELVGKHFPAMALVEVSDLLEPGAKVEIQGLAVLPSTPPESE
jgi:enamine deaminase RidA (YjgF/YER057c/UK114 family)